MDKRYGYFFKAVEVGSFVGAAKSMFVSPPVVTKEISSLERELGFKLFDRSERKTRLTDAGRLFYERVKPLQGELRDAIEECRALAHEVPPVLRIGVLDMETQRVVPTITRRIEREFPRMAIRHKAITYDAPVDPLLAHEIDFFILTGTVDLGSPGISTSLIWNSNPVAMVPSPHPLSSRDFLTVEDFADKKLIFFEKGYSVYHDKLQEEMKREVPSIRFEVIKSSYEFQLGVQFDNCFTICPDVYPKPAEAYRLIPLKGEMFGPIPISIVTRSQQSSFQDALLRIAREAMAEVAEDPIF